MKSDLYQKVTDKILADLENGVKPWAKPWNAGNANGRIQRPLRHNGQPYNGINVLMLWSDAQDKGFESPMWMTFRQAKELGGHVRKGEKGSLVVYANRITKRDKDTDEEHSFMLWKGYTVFNVDQIDDLPDSYYGSKPEPINVEERNETAERFAAATQAMIQHGGNRAFYAPSVDHVQMPHFEFFRDAGSYYATLMHELTHWTSAKPRLDRKLGKRFGDEAYAAEELIAEMGAAFLCADLGLSPEPRDDHASYIDSWVKVLKNDKRAIFTAASQASKAADYLNGLQKL